MTYTQKDLLTNWKILVEKSQQNLTNTDPLWEDGIIVMYDYAVDFLLKQCQMTLLAGDSEMRHNLANQIEEFIK